MTVDMAGDSEKEARPTQGLRLGAGMGLPGETFPLEDGVGFILASLPVSA